MTEECSPANQIRWRLEAGWGSTSWASITLHCIALYCTVLYCTVLYCTVLHCTVLYCTSGQGIPAYILHCIATLFEETRLVRPREAEDFIFLSNFLGSNNTAEESIARLESILTCLIGHTGDTVLYCTMSLPQVLCGR